MNPESRSCVVFTSPLFFRDPEYRYIRDINVNRDVQQHELDRVLGPGKSDGWTPSRHYYSAGEVNAVLKFISSFRDEGIHLEYRVIGRWQG